MSSSFDSKPTTQQFQLVDKQTQHEVQLPYTGGFMQ